MDLREFKAFDNPERHPWELARLKAVRSILKPLLGRNITVLDYGCGDGFVSRGLIEGSEIKSVWAYDPHLTDATIARLKKDSRIRYSAKLPSGGAYGLILLLDVVEHVDDDRGFMKDIASMVSAGGSVLVTVPAFQGLMGPHDISLGHHRRYGLDTLARLMEGSGLKVSASGYLFMTPLAHRFFTVRFGKVFPSLRTRKDGVGGWKGGKALTRAVATLLGFENRIALALGRFGVKLPGLTVWTLCQKQR